ncbi:hypothetical protein V6N13_012744 [Hibiscus sabdariffa]
MEGEASAKQSPKTVPFSQLDQVDSNFAMALALQEQDRLNPLGTATTAGAMGLRKEGFVLNCVVLVCLWTCAFGFLSPKDLISGPRDLESMSQDVGSGSDARRRRASRQVGSFSTRSGANDLTDNSSLLVPAVELSGPR